MSVKRQALELSICAPARQRFCSSGAWLFFVALQLDQTGALPRNRVTFPLESILLIINSTNLSYDIRFLVTV